MKISNFYYHPQFQFLSLPAKTDKVLFVYYEIFMSVIDPPSFE